MDQNGNDIPGSSSPTPFSFLRLLCGDDWHLWDTYPTVDVSPNLPADPTVEMNHDGLTIESDPLSMTLTREQTVEQWLQTLTNEGFEISSQEDDIQEVQMSPDEDNFSYEELLAIVEQIGDVCTGLDVETIDENLSRRKYEDSSGQTETCVICLSEFKHNDDASKLACGHDFHFGCIKKWLVVKNKCPLCKQKAL